MAYCIFFITLALMPVALEARDVYAGSCNDDYRDQYQCLTQKLRDRQGDRDRSFYIPRDSDQDRIRDSVDRCLRRSRCDRATFLSRDEADARDNCFSQAKSQIDSDLQSCASGRSFPLYSNVPDFQVADTYPQQTVEKWRYLVARVNDVLQNPFRYCDRDRDGDDVKSCIRAIRDYDFDRQQLPSGLPYFWCDDYQSCYQNNHYDCRRKWEDDIQKTLCQCSTRGRRGNILRDAQDAYRQCFRNRFRGSPPNDDPVPNWLDDYLDSYCKNSCSNQRSGRN